MIDITTPEDFEQHVTNGKLVLLDFWAPWCGPCRMLHPVLEDLQAAEPDLVIAKVNVDANRPLAQAFGVRGIPALYFMKNGERVDQLAGMQTLNALRDRVARARQS